ncbi:unnamed protein product [Eruca vesicaria subsp. sativa]|uniref:Uncharacterized protein n=1 Tax=Eruca vesicaria subsp. sativa TaxID=29727 RepID=A0ABC8JD68_ERUVS|nr:unnamed protein product [Eruca vesicaria subsp. sativa]
MDLQNRQIAENNRRGGTANLQTNHRNHPTVGHIIRASEHDWLSARDVYLILRQRRSLTVSGNLNPRHGIQGLFLFYCHRFFNYRNGFIDRHTFIRSHGENNIRVTQSRPLIPVPLAPTYHRRLHRCHSR